MDFGLSESTIDKIIKVLSKYQELEKAIIYGSRAKGNYKPGSDIDLTFLGEGLNQKILNKIEDDIDDLMLPYTFDLSILSKVTNSDFIDHVSRVGIIFYDRQVKEEVVNQ